MSEIRGIPNNELDENVRKAIKKIVSHRGEIRRFATALGGITAFGTSLPILNRDKYSAIGAPLIIGLASLKTLHGHKETYAEEELVLYRAIRESRNPKIAKLMQTYPYIVVNRRGDLIGKELNPKIGFVPIGRRRIKTQIRPPKARKVGL